MKNLIFILFLIPSLLFGQGIELTTEQNTKIVLGIDEINFIRPLGTGSNVFLVGKQYRVTENIDTIVARSCSKLIKIQVYENNQAVDIGINVLEIESMTPTATSAARIKFKGGYVLLETQDTYATLKTLFTECLTGTGGGGGASGDGIYGGSGNIYPGAIATVDGGSNFRINYSNNTSGIFIQDIPGSITITGINSSTGITAGEDEFSLFTPDMGLFSTLGETSITGNDPGFKGFTYAADYSANFTDRSLVDKAYVDANTGGSLGTGFTAGGGTGTVPNATTLDLPSNANFIIQGIYPGLYTNIFAMRVDEGSIGLIATNDDFNKTLELFPFAFTLNSEAFTLKASSTDIINGPGLIYEDKGLVKRGIQYNADYSADFTDRSLVDKAYVDANNGESLGIGFTNGGGSGSIPSGTIINVPDSLSFDFENHGIISYSLKSDQVLQFGDMQGFTGFIQDEDNYWGVGGDYAYDGNFAIFSSTSLDGGISKIQTKSSGSVYEIYAFSATGNSGFYTSPGYMNLNVGSEGLGYANILLTLSNDVPLSNVYKGITFTVGPSATDNITVVDLKSSPIGIKYADDYSATFVDRSLVDKGYADGAGYVRPIVLYSDDPHTVGASDVGKLLKVVDAAILLPDDAGYNFPIGQEIYMYQHGTTVLEITPDGTAIVMYPVGMTNKARARFSSVTATKIAANTWLLRGDLLPE